MAQFDVHKNKGRSGDRYPYLVVVQSGLLRRWNRRVVIPLGRADVFEPAPELNPSVMIAGERYRLMTHEVTNVPGDTLGDKVANITDDGDRIVAALDLVFSRGHPFA